MIRLVNSAYMRRPAVLATVCVVFVLTAVLSGGCGKKGPPVVPGAIPLAAVTDLEGALEQSRVTLSWSHTTDNRRARNYIILRAQTDLSRADACTGCPMVFQKVGEVAIGKPHQELPRRMAFSMTVPKGFRYTFSVRPSQSSGVQGPESNLVEIILPK